MVARLQHVNHETPLDLNDLQWQQEVYEDEFLKRMQLVMGYTPASPALTEYGIVDSSAPTSVAETSTRPLVPYKSASDGTKFDLRPGMAVTKSGFLIVLEATQTLVQPPTNNVGDEFVILLEYDTQEPSDYNELTRYDGLTSTRTTVVDEEDLLKVVSLAGWNDPTEFSDIRKEQCVVLAVAEMVSTDTTMTTGKQLLFEYVSTTYDYNRPWFSLVDIYHRSQVGTGTVTSNDPHGLAIGDLSQGGLTLYQQILEHGMVLSKDYSVSRVPGIKCYEDIESGTRWTQDVTGDVTGRAGARYAEMEAYPIRLGVAVDSTVNDPYSSGAGDVICVYVLPGTNILVMDDSEWPLLPGDDLRVHYMAAYASQPPVPESDMREMTFTQIQSGRELIVSDGLAIDSIPNLVVDLSTFGAIPSWVRIFMDGSGNYVVTPQCLVPTTKLSSVTLGSSNRIDTTLLGTSRLRVGLAEATAGGTLDVQVTINGTVDGVADTETVTFGALWADPVIPDCEASVRNEIVGDPGQYLITTKLFESVTSWSVDALTDAGPIAEIVVAALSDFPNTIAMREYVPICEVNWDGLRACAIRDIRPVDKLVRVPKKFNPLMLAAKLITPGGVLLDWSSYISSQPWIRQTDRKPEFEVTVEDLEDPKYNALISPDTTYTDMMADHWQEGLGENCFVRGDVANSRVQYISRPFYVPHEGTGLIADSFPQYDGLRFMLVYDDDPERSRNFWGGGPRREDTGYDERPVPQIRYTTRANPNVWRGWYTLSKEDPASTVYRVTNAWYLNAYDNTLAALDYFYKFQVRLNGGGKARGWVAYWEKTEQISSDTRVGVWEFDGTAFTLDELVNDNGDFAISYVSHPGSGIYTMDVTYGGVAPIASKYAVWVEGRSFAFPLDTVGIVKSGTPGRFTVYTVSNPISADTDFNVHIIVRAGDLT